MTGTSESKFGVGRANVLERHLEIENTTTDECEDECGDHLTRESVPRRDLDVVGELEVIGELQSLVAGDVTIGLEPDEGVGVP